MPKWLHVKAIVCSRTVSIALADIADAGVLLVLFRRNGTLSPADVELFWVKQFIAFAIYSSLQLWTLAYQTGRGDEFAATIDKVFAASPAIVPALVEMYWIGHDSAATLP